LEDRGRVGEHLRALRGVGVVGDRAAYAGTGLDQHLVTALAKLAHAGRRQGDPILVLLDLGGDADPHDAVLVESGGDSSTGVLATSKRTPRCSSSANISAGSMQLSGGSAPRFVMLPRARSLTAAAAGVAVETIPPPRPHSSLGGVTLLARITVSAPTTSTIGIDSAVAGGGEAEGATSGIGSSVGPDSSFRLSSTLGDNESAKVTFGALKLGPKVRTSEWRVKMVSAFPIGSPKSTVGPSWRGRISSGRPLITAIGGIVISSRSVLTAYGKLRPSGGSRSRPAARTEIEDGSPGSSRTARTASRLVLPGAEPIPSRARRPRCSNSPESSSCSWVTW